MQARSRSTGFITFQGPPEYFNLFLSEAGASASDYDISLSADDARRLAADRINAAYPIHRQLNTLRTGTVEGIAAMGAFIDAVRAWSNAENPQLADLDAIQPA